jgi:hypothetical protein
MEHPVVLFSSVLKIYIQTGLYPVTCLPFIIGQILLFLCALEKNI